MIRLKLTLYFRIRTCYKEGRGKWAIIDKHSEVLCLIISQYHMCSPSRREMLAEMLEPEVISAATIFSAKIIISLNTKFSP